MNASSFMQILFWTIMILFVGLSVIMILLVLIQKGRGGGISSAFGGGGGGSSAFGAKTGDVLTWATSIVFALFVLLAVVLNLVTDKIDASSQPQQQTIIGGTSSHSTPPPPAIPNP
jgi:protein translocase SecG subunit